MHGFFKTLFGDKNTLAIAAASILIAFAVLHSAATIFTGLIFPLCLLAGTGILARL
jgi:hypothetical protein